MSTTLFAVVATIALHGVLAVDHAGLTVDQLGLDVSHAGLAIDQVGLAVDHEGLDVDRASLVVDHAGLVLGGQHASPAR